jgi:hypothetical protein
MISGIYRPRDATYSPWATSVAAKESHRNSRCDASRRQVCRHRSAARPYRSRKPLSVHHSRNSASTWGESMAPRSLRPPVFAGAGSLPSSIRIRMRLLSISSTPAFASPSQGRALEAGPYADLWPKSNSYGDRRSDPRSPADLADIQSLRNALIAVNRSFVRSNWPFIRSASQYNFSAAASASTKRDAETCNCGRSDYRIVRKLACPAELIRELSTRGGLQTMTTKALASTE